MDGQPPEQLTYVLVGIGTVCLPKEDSAEEGVQDAKDRREREGKMPEQRVWERHLREVGITQQLSALQPPGHHSLTQGLRQSRGVVIASFLLDRARGLGRRNRDS